MQNIVNINIQKTVFIQELLLYGFSNLTYNIVTYTKLYVTIIVQYLFIFVYILAKMS